MTDDVRSRPRSGRIRLVAELVIAAFGIGGAGFGFYANEAKNEAQSQAQSLSVEVNILDGDNQSLSVENEELSDEVQDLQAAVDAAGVEVDTVEEIGTGHLELDDAVDLVSCDNVGGASTSGWWYADAARFNGEDHWQGLSCSPYVSTNESCCGSGHLDFLVPTGAQLVSGVAGFDDRSVDTTMTAEFVIQSVPATDEPLFSEILSFGDTADFELDLTGHTRIRLQINVRDSEATSWETGAIASWADVRFA